MASDDLRAAAERLEHAKAENAWPYNVNIPGRTADMRLLADYAVQHLTAPLPTDVEAEFRAAARQALNRLHSPIGYRSPEDILMDAFRPLLARAPGREAT